jgi:hypothetical protein
MREGKGKSKGMKGEGEHLARRVIFGSVEKFGVAAVDETVLLHTVPVQIHVQDWRRERERGGPGGRGGERERWGRESARMRVSERERELCSVLHDAARCIDKRRHSKFSSR